MKLISHVKQIPSVSDQKEHMMSPNHNDQLQFSFYNFLCLHDVYGHKSMWSLTLLKLIHDRSFTFQSCIFSIPISRSTTLLLGILLRASVLETNTKKPV